MLPGKGILLAVVLAAFSTAALGQDSNYFAGKNVTYIVATNAGGGYDTYARLIGPYLESYLGANHVIIRNVPGAGHLIGANTLARSLANGLTIGTFNAGLIYTQLLENAALQFRLEDLAWIGKAAGEPRAVVVATRCSHQSIEDLIDAREPAVFAGAGIGSASYADTRLLAEALKLNVRIIPGYEGTEAEMAMMRGEICGLVASTSSVQGFVDAGYGKFVLTVGGEIEGVPNAIDFARDDHARQIVTLISAMAKLGRISAAPAGTPGETLATLRAAYRSALEDPTLLADARARGRPIEPAFGEEVSQLINAALDQTPELLDLIARVLGPDSL